MQRDRAAEMAATVLARDMPAPASGLAATVAAYRGGSEQPPSVREPPGSAPFSLPGAILARFDSLQFLGKGGMGVVYRAKDRQLDRDVALKFLVGDASENSGQLLREARSQARLEHENACKVYEVDVTAGRCYIVMQYIHGESLDKAHERLTLKQKVRVIRKIALALHEAHQMGLVHRDVKPGNIMVEQAEEGAYKPYLMDFGIARQVGEGGQTMTGVGFGTPAFMAPEQALGDARLLDRRADVYSLGATLYDILCGAPPFVDSNLPVLVQRLAHEKPVPLRRMAAGIPEDLEAIVMKCLEKEPWRRYESARALGEDLERFLDGEPVKARPASLGYILLKKTQKHKAKVALAALALVAFCAVLVVWIRSRQLASEQARLSSELGADVKEMELLLRGAYSLPLHDIEREKDMIRRRLRTIEERTIVAGTSGAALKDYALGRGYLALRDPAKALEHMRRAGAAGYAAPGLEYATGFSLGELYKKAIEATARIENPEEKKARVTAIEAAYKIPALRHLRAAVGATMEVSEYVEGLIALYEGKHEEAIAKAKRAFDQAPWLYEAKKLEGDAHFAEGSRFRHDAAFDYDRMMVHFRHAEDAYRSAAEIARSDPEVHAANCELWIQVMYASQSHPDSLEESFDKAKLACERAIAASSRDSTARIKLAFAYATLAWQIQSTPSHREDDTLVDDAILHAEAAVRISPDNAMAHYVSGATRRTKFLHLLNRGLDARGLIQRAIAGYDEALRIDPAFIWALNESCASYAEKALIETWSGQDPSASVQKAVERCDRAIAVDPKFTYPYINKALAHCRMARHVMDAGQSPESAVHAALDAAGTASVQSPDLVGAANLSAWAAHLQAAFETDAGRDPGAWLARAEASAREVDRLAPASLMSHELRGMLASTRALSQLRRGEGFEPELRKARDSFQRLVDAAPWDLGYRVGRAHVELLQLRRALAHRTVDEAELRAALTPVLPMLETERAQPHLYQIVAEIHEIHAIWLLSRRKAAAETISKGLEMADKALAINPTMATALATKASLVLLSARAARDPRAQYDATHGAKELFAKAFQANPLLQQDQSLAWKQAERLTPRKTPARSLQPSPAPRP